MSEESPVTEAAGHAAQAAALSVRFLVTIARAIAEDSANRLAAHDPARAAQVERLRQLGRPADDPAERYAATVRETFANPALRDALLNSPQWSQIAGDLSHLESAGVDVRAFLGEAGRIAERIAATLNPPSRSAQYERMVREHLPGTIAETLLASTEWPQIAEELRQMQETGINVPEMLREAAEPGQRLEAAMRTAWQRSAERAARLEREAAPAFTGPRQPSRGDGRARRGPGTDGRAQQLADFGLTSAESDHYVRVMRDSGVSTRHAELLAVSRRWPQIAATMRDLNDRRIDPSARIAQLSEMVDRQGRVQGGRVDITEAAVAALRQPAPNTPRATTANRAERTARATAAAPTGPPRAVPLQLREAAHHAIHLKDGVTAGFLATRMGITQAEARPLVEELAARDVIGRYDPATDRYAPQAETTDAADLLLDGREVTAVQANRRVIAEAARAVSPSAAGPPRAKAKAAAAAPVATVRRAPEHAPRRGR